MDKSIEQFYDRVLLDARAGTIHHLFQGPSTPIPLWRKVIWPLKKAIMWVFHEHYYGIPRRSMSGLKGTRKTQPKRRRK